MRKGSVFLPIFFVVSCATAEYGRSIQPEEVQWIKKGVTTREEIIQKFGTPLSEVPEFSNLDFESTSTTTKTIEGDSEKTVTTTKMIQKNKLTKAAYFYSKTEGTLFSMDTTAQTFWVIYNESGIVQNFGFADHPTLLVQ